MNQSDKSGLDDREIWLDYITAQGFEHALIDRKTTWWLTAQALLFTAYGITFQAAISPVEFQHAIALTGVAVAALTGIGVIAVIFSKFLSWRQYRKFFCSYRHSPPQPLDERPLQWGVRTPNTIITLLPDLVLPIVFIVAWSYLLSLS